MSAAAASARSRDTNVDTSVAAALSAMAAIGLGELNRVAALQSRVDRKYVLPGAAATEILHRLRASARALQIDGRRETRYSSVYFDTPTLDCFRGTAFRRRRRFKVRTRRYLDTGACFLEVKTRGRRGVTVKVRAGHPADDAARLGRDGRRWIAEVLAAADLDPTLAASLEPVLRTDYRRATLYLPDGPARLTIDSGLTWSHADAMADTGGLVVIETKSSGAPGRADRLLWATGIRPTRLSKYATGIALLRPDLPANRWHRVLDQQIRPTGTPFLSRRGASDRGGPS